MSALSPSGWALVALAAVLVISGVLLRNAAFVGVGVTFGLAVLVAVVTTSRHPDLVVARTSHPERLTVGGTADIEVTVTNDGRRRTRRRSGHDNWGGTSVTLQIPALAPGESFRHVDRFTPIRRGVVPVGPLRLSRADPFGLVRGGGQAGDVARLVVQPATATLHGLPAGRRRDLDGPTSSVAPEGGIAFHTLREYAPGDDLRLVHWRSTARSGRLMVRRNVDTNQPDLVLVLDTRAAAYDGEAFEVGVSAMASVVQTTRATSSTAALATTAGDPPVVQGPTDDDWSLPDLLAGVQAGTGVDVVDVVASMAPRDPGQSLVVVTGRLTGDDLARLCIAAGRFSHVIVASVGPIRRVEDADGATVLHVDTLDAFARFWNGGTA